jgi:predicted GIY-YIG superfamily endonuclease
MMPNQNPQFKKLRGYTVFIAECKNGSYYTGMTLNLRNEIKKINAGGYGKFFKRFHYKNYLPIKVVFKEDDLLFSEAMAKFFVLRDMKRMYRKRLIDEGRWPLSKILRSLLAQKEPKL